MPAPQSPVDICNLALDYLGQDSVIASITLPESREEIIMSHHYDLTRQCLLRAHAFSFAWTEATLAKTRGQTQDYKEGFLLPADSLRLMRIGSSIFPINDYRIEDRTILVSGLFTAPSISSLIIQYIRDEERVELMEPLFIQLLALELANRLSYKFNRSVEQQQEINKLLVQETAKCVGTRWQESKPRRVDLSRAIQARYIQTEFIIAPNEIYWLNVP
jgi:hypothetical protein